MKLAWLACSATGEVYFVTRKLARFKKKETIPDSKISSHNLMRNGEGRSEGRAASHAYTALAMHARSPRRAILPPAVDLRVV